MAKWSWAGTISILVMVSTYATAQVGPPKHQLTPDHTTVGKPWRPTMQVDIMASPAQCCPIHTETNANGEPVAVSSCHFVLTGIRKPIETTAYSAVIEGSRLIGNPAYGYWHIIFGFGEDRNGNEIPPVIFYRPGQYPFGLFISCHTGSGSHFSSDLSDNIQYFLSATVTVDPAASVDQRVIFICRQEFLLPSREIPAGTRGQSEYVCMYRMCLANGAQIPSWDYNRCR